MRHLADQIGLTASSIYHRFPNKDALLNQAFETTRAELFQSIQALPPVDSIEAKLCQRIAFSLHHAVEIVFLLRYFLYYKVEFAKHDQGYVPTRAYAHLIEVIEEGVDQGVFHSQDPTADAKVIIHSVNGFILEYYPDVDDHIIDQVADTIADFALRALTK